MSLKAVWFATGAALIAGSALAAPPKNVPRDAKLWAAAVAARAEQLKLLQQAVDIDSGTRDVEGGRKVGAIFAVRLSGLGYALESVKAEAPGLPDNLVATL